LHEGRHENQKIVGCEEALTYEGHPKRTTAQKREQQTERWTSATLKTATQKKFFKVTIRIIAA